MTAATENTNHFAVLGLGEAGSEISADLAACEQAVLGYDIAQVEPPEGVTMVSEPTHAVDGASVVLALVPVTDALAAAKSALPALGSGSIYADCCSGAPQLKRKLATLIERSSAAFVDVALMGTVPGRGLSTPALASGPGAERLVEILSSLGMPIEAISNAPGDAATRKLLRSVFVKGFTGAIMEALEAAQAAGCSEWLWGNIVEELERADEALVKRLVDGTYKHACRRADEMAAVEQLLESLGVEAHITRSAITRLETLASEQSRKGDRQRCERP